MVKNVSVAQGTGTTEWIILTKPNEGGSVEAHYKHIPIVLSPFKTYQYWESGLQ